MTLEEDTPSPRKKVKEEEDYLSTEELDRSSSAASQWQGSHQTENPLEGGAKESHMGG
jgi:hypothetical protein